MKAIIPKERKAPQDTFIMVQVTISEFVTDYYKLYAKEFAQSAFDNEVDLDSFKASMDNFSHTSTSSIPQIQAWRDEATEIFFDLLEKAGKLKLTPVEFEGGSDFDDDEMALVDDNTNNDTIERNNQNGKHES